MNHTIPYKERLRIYERWKKEGIPGALRQGGYAMYINTINSVEHDYTLTINDVASILGFTVEHVQNHVLNHLSVADAREFIELPDGREVNLRGLLGNNRLKKVVSKTSLEEYITSNLSFSGRRTVFTIERNERYIDEIKSVIGKGGSIQRLMNDAGKYLDTILDSKELEKEEEKRKEKMRKKASDFNENISRYALNENMLDVIDYACDVESTDNMFDVLVKNMYSIKELKRKQGFKHTMQIYRYLDEVSYVVIKLNSPDFNEDDENCTKRGVISDRNIRYIITNERLDVAKGVYRISFNHPVFNKMQDAAELMGVDIKDIIMNKVLSFAKENKEKYKKKTKDTV